VLKMGKAGDSDGVHGLAFPCASKFGRTDDMSRLFRTFVFDLVICREVLILN
jgi:hypothetical protein